MRIISAAAAGLMIVIWLACASAHLQPGLFKRDLPKHPHLPNRTGLQDLIQHPLRIGNVQFQQLPASRRPLVPPLQDRKHRGEQPFKRDLEAMGQ